MIQLTEELEKARKASGLSQEALATQAGLSRMTVQRIESGQIDPRLSTLLEMARVLGLELMPVPAALRPQLEDFVRSGGRLLGQPAGVGAPPSIAQSLADDNR
ncbi:helix-turn-helix domain-containing protein [Acidovorax cavernicola]|uniref:XRE family transcriptional regulator n=1 Tax=Acidovorax cavernicola TaxID=1675792 RepID=A0A9X8D1Y8_9BURK|nr:helix-turn-helix transcriptional regulator [Acidovorax cavernicola]RIX76568.1 XRE family transcriptional regulator [Acidovorax cavernicola]